jgi:DNA-binding response OmpR family regulator
MTRSPFALVVDDEPDLLATYERLLRRKGVTAVTASSVALARAALGRERPDLVICDLRLPDGDGLDVVRAARAAAPPVPVIVVTGFPSDETRRTALGAGATAFLSKPFAAAALLAAVDASLDGRATDLAR